MHIYVCIHICVCMHTYIYVYRCISIYSKHGDTWPCDTRHRVFLDFFSLILFLSPPFQFFLSTWPCDTRHRVFLDFFSLILFLSPPFQFFLSLTCVCIYTYVNIHIWIHVCIHWFTYCKCMWINVHVYKFVASQSLHNTNFLIKKNPAKQKTAQFLPFFFWLHKRAKPAPPPYRLPLPTYPPIPHTPPIRLRAFRLYQTLVWTLNPQNPSVKSIWILLCFHNNTKKKLFSYYTCFYVYC